MAFAELRCAAQGWAHRMTEPSVVLGRKGKGPDGEAADVVLSGSKGISRRHAIVAVVEGTSPPELALSCVGKNHVLVNGEVKGAGAVDVRLRGGDVLAIGGTELEVVTAPALLSLSAAGAGSGSDSDADPFADLEAGLGLTSTEVAAKQRGAQEVSFSRPGSLGMKIAPDSPGGRGQVVVLSVDPGSQAAEHPAVEPGLPLERIAGQSVAGLPYTEVTRIIGEHTERPLTVAFGSPPPRAEAQPSVGGGAAQSPQNAYTSSAWEDREREFRAHDEQLAEARRARKQRHTEAAQGNTYIRNVLKQDRKVAAAQAAAEEVAKPQPQRQPEPEPELAAAAAAAGAGLKSRSEQAAKRRSQSARRPKTPQRKTGPRPRSRARSPSPARLATRSPAALRAKSPQHRSFRAAAQVVQAAAAFRDPRQAFLKEAMDRLCAGLNSKLKAEEAFRKIDKDNSGELDAREFHLALKYLHIHLNERQIEVLMKHLDKDGDGVISIEEFMSVIWERKLQQLRDKFRQLSYSFAGQDWEALFHQFDRSSSGELTYEDFRRAVRKHVGMKESVVTDVELREMFNHVDSDRTGDIGFDEFAKLMALDTEPVSHDRFDSIPGQIFHKMLQHAASKRTNLMHLFNRFDKDDSGGLDREEFRLAMAELGIIITDGQMDAVMDECSTQGFISTEDFVRRMRDAKNDARAAAADDYEAKTVLDSQPAPGGAVRKKRPKTPRRATTPRATTPRATTPTAAPVAARAANPQKAFLDEAMDRLCAGIGSKLKAKEAFRKIDKDNSGELDGPEFKLALKYLNLRLNDRQIEVVMKHLDQDGDGTISIEEFLNLVWEGKLKQLRKKFHAAAYTSGGVNLDLLFRQFDHDNSGELEYEEFRQAVRKTVGMKQNDVTDAELREMFDHVDKDGSGEIGLAEFKELLHIDTTVTHDRHDSVPGQVFAKILQEGHKRRANLLHLFHRFDTDDSGGLDRSEFKAAMLELDISLSKEQMQEVMDDIDKSGEGFISTESFVSRMREAKKDIRQAEKAGHRTESTLTQAAGGAAARRRSRSKSPAPVRASSAQARTPRRAATSPTPRPRTPARSAEGFLDEAMDRLCDELSSKLKAKEAFRKIDKDNSGELDKAEFKLALKYLNLRFNDRQIDAVVKHLDKDGDGAISIEEFLSVVWERKLQQLRDKFQAAAYTTGGVNLDLLFRQYDHDNSGELEYEEFRQAVRKTAMMKQNDVTDAELREMFEHVDKDGGGSIGLAEFKELLFVDTTATLQASKNRHESKAGQVFNKILLEADRRFCNLLHLFHRFDTDDSGGLEPDELKAALLELEIVLDEEELEEVMGEMDRDGDGYVTTKEFSDRMRLAKRDHREMLRLQQKLERSALRREKLGHVPLPEAASPIAAGPEEPPTQPARPTHSARPRSRSRSRSPRFGGEALSPVLPASSKPTPQPAEQEPAPEVGVFAELRCIKEGWAYPMTKRSVVLGRQGKSGQTADVVLSGSKSISRRHAIVSVVEGTSPPELALSCVGKNHVLVNGEVKGAGAVDVRLRNGDQIAIGGTTVLEIAYV
eukprot:COSAG04_NODE_204_length_20429_cov_6.166896_9_plen_1552_part_00